MVVVIVLQTATTYTTLFLILQVSSIHKGTSIALGNTMGSGKHYVTFERSECETNQVYVGIMRPVNADSLREKVSVSVTFVYFNCKFYSEANL